MTVLSRHQMKEVNETSPNIASALTHYKDAAGRLLLLKTMRAVDAAAKILADEIVEMREAFDNSGRRPKVKSARHRTASGIAARRAAKLEHRKFCPFCKEVHYGGDVCMGHHP